MGNGIIFGAAMAEKKIENGKVRYSAAYPTGREHIAKGLLYHGVWYAKISLAELS